MADFNARLRAQMLRQAIFQAGDDPTLSTVAAWLPPDFFSTDTDELEANAAELANMIALMAAEQPQEFLAESEPEPTPKAAAWSKPITASDMPVPLSDEHDPVQQPPTLTFEEARELVVRWGNQLSKARGALMAALLRQRDGRTKLEKVIGQFVSGLPAKTQESLRREYLASEAERRQRVADGLEPPLGARQKPAGYMTAMRAGQRGRSVNQGYGNKHVGKARSLIEQQRAAGLKPAVLTVPSER
jgi:hypothetical protein